MAKKPQSPGQALTQLLITIQTNIAKINKLMFETNKAIVSFEEAMMELKNKEEAEENEEEDDEDGDI